LAVGYNFGLLEEIKWDAVKEWLEKNDVHSPH